MSGAAPKPVNLALQGGRAHGAFTWGVLDRLLEDERLQIEGNSGCSTGAMNAVALMSGSGGLSTAANCKATGGSACTASTTARR